MSSPLGVKTVDGVAGEIHENLFEAVRRRLTSAGGFQNPQGDMDAGTEFSDHSTTKGGERHAHGPCAFRSNGLRRGGTRSQSAARTCRPAHRTDAA